MNLIYKCYKHISYRVFDSIVCHIVSLFERITEFIICTMNILIGWSVSLISHKRGVWQMFGTAVIVFVVSDRVWMCKWAWPAVVNPHFTTSRIGLRRLLLNKRTTVIYRRAEQSAKATSHPHAPTFTPARRQNHAPPPQFGTAQKGNLKISNNGILRAFATALCIDLSLLLGRRQRRRPSRRRQAGRELCMHLPGRNLDGWQRADIEVANTSSFISTLRRV